MEKCPKFQFRVRIERKHFVTSFSSTSKSKKMSGWDQHQSYDFGGGQSYYDPSSYNYDQGDQSQFGSAPSSKEEDFSNEPPLLEELGINPDHIVQKTLTVLNPLRSTRSEVAGDADLAGPLVFCCAFGSLLLLTGTIFWPLNCFLVLLYDFLSSNVETLF